MSTTTLKKTIEDYQFVEEELKVMNKDACISDCDKYRYWLTRVWAEELPRVMYVLLNPSTADHTIDDPTIKKCMGFAKGMGCGSIEVVNLFAYRATSPKELKRIIKEEGEAAAIGPENDKYIEEAVNRAHLVVAGWGNNAKGMKRCEEVLQLLKGKEVKYFDITKEKQPKHPLYIKFLDVQDKELLESYTLESR